VCSSDLGRHANGAPIATGALQITFDGRHVSKRHGYTDQRNWRHYRRGHDNRCASRRHHKRCEEITSLKRFGYGRRAVIAETLCHDKHGRPFIVRGSRRVVGYLR